MNRLPQQLRIEICKYLDATEIANVCEALPCMKLVLTSRIVQGILRNFVGQMEWVDATLCCMLYSTLAFVEREAESVIESELEGKVLYRAIRRYQEGCLFSSRRVRRDLLNRGTPFRFLVLGRSIVDLDHLSPFLSSLRDSNVRGGLQLHAKRFVDANCIETVIRMPTFTIQLNMKHLEERSANYRGIFTTSYLCEFDGVVYMVDSALQCHVGRSLPLGLRRLIFRITHLAVSGTTRPLLLFILDTNSRLTESSTDRGSHFECLIAGLHKLDQITLRGYDGSAATSSPCNWWRVCRLHQQDGMFVNLNEAFQMAALQIASINARGSDQGQSTSTKFTSDTI